MDDNGSGNGGGNSSVWWEIRHGSVRKRQQLEPVGFEPQTSAPAAAGLGSPVESRRRPRRGPYDRPGSGQVRLSSDDEKGHSRLEIHDRTGLDDIGAPDHTGMFRVRLRIKKAQMDALVANEKDPDRRQKLEGYREALPRIAAMLADFTGPPPLADGESASPDDVYLVVDVPAIERKPADGEAWPYMPWEIYWQW